MKKIFTAFIFLILSMGVLKAQPVLISQGGTVNTCDTTVADAGGLAGNYSPNENYTITFCPDGTNGNVISLILDTIGIDGSDTLYIYDGTDPNTDSLLMVINNDTNYLGVATAVMATLNNHTGCLTLVFQSDGAGEDFGFEGTVSCQMLCQTIIPEIVVTDPPSVPNADSGYIDICLGDTVQFVGTGNFPYTTLSTGAWYNQTNENSIFSWYFGDGDSLVGPGLTTVTHVFDKQQVGYITKLVITDSLGCRSTAFATRKVRVSTTPLFSGVDVIQDTVCFGNPVQITQGVTPTQGVFSSGGIYGDSLMVPDNVGTIYETQIVIESFAPGQVVTSANDFLSVCANLEHSYLGDLDITLICPNGQTMTILNYPSGGGSTFLGEPVDDDNQPLVMGVTYQYCWTPNPTYGTFANEANSYFYTYTDVLGNTYSNHPYLPPGDYAPEGSFNDLVGCPLNGTWTIQIIDNLGSDNGFVAGWGITFDPSLLPDPEYYTPTYSSSTYTWSGDSIVGVNNDTATVLPQTPGDVLYTFSATDNFGCTYDTTVSVHVIEFISNIVTDTTVCFGDSSKITVFAGPPVCDYTLEMLDSWGDGWNGGFLEIEVNGNSIGTFSASGSSSMVTITFNDGDVFSLIYTSGSFESENSYTLYDNNGNPVFSDGPSPATGIVYTGTASCSPNGGSLTYQWIPSTFLSNDTIADPYVTPTTDITYQVVITDTALGCQDTSTVNIYTVPNFTYTITQSDSVACLYEQVDLNVSVSSSATTFYYNWSNEQFLNQDSIPNPVATFSQPGNINFGVTISSYAGCDKVDTVHVLVSEGSLPNIEITGDSTMCLGGSVNLHMVNDLPQGIPCNYSIELFDNFGDGWDGIDTSYVVIYTNNNVVIDSFTILNGVSVTYPVPVTHGDSLIVEYVPDNASFPPTNNENQYNIYDVSGNMIFSDGDYQDLSQSSAPAPGVVFMTTVSCGTPSNTNYSINWSPGAYLDDSTSTDPVAASPVNTTFLLVVEDTIGKCSDTAAFNVYIVDNFNWTVTIDDDSLCLNETANFTVTPDLTTVNFDYAWSNNSSLNDSINSNTYLTSPGEEVYVSITSAAGCTNVDTIRVLVTPSVQPTITDIIPNSVCENTPSQLSFALAGGNCDYILDMFDSFGDGWNGGTLEVLINGNSIGVYAPTASSLTVAIPVVQGDTIELNYTSGAFESENSYNLYDSDGNLIFSDGPSPATGLVFTTVATCIYMNNYTYSWSPGNVMSDSSAYQPEITISQNTGVTLVITDSIGGCSGSYSEVISVTEYPDPTITPNDSIVCIRDSIVSIQPAVSGGTFSGQGVDPTTGELNTYIAGSGNVTVTYTVANNMCVSDTTINIQIDPVPSAPFATASNPYCEGSDIENVVASAQGLVNWYADSLMTTLLDTGVVPDNLGKIFNAMNIYVTQVVGACESDPAAVSLTVIPTPQVNFEANPEEQQVNEPVEFINHTDTAGMDTLMFTWNFGDGASSSEEQPQHVYAAIGEYTVSLKAENSEGCYTVDSLTVIIKEDFVFIVPNIFTPNGDGNNDEFKILLQGVQTMHLEIYNRWGRKVYETNDINASWDGGKQKDGVYFWIATGTTTQGDSFEKRGNVTLSGNRQ